MQKNKRAAKNKKLIVGENEIAEVIAGWTKIPVNRLTESEAQRLQKLESVLHKRVVGQEEAVSAVAKAVRRGRVGLKDPKRPIGSFLFLGPTGVGKTEVSKALAEAVFGNENATKLDYIVNNINNGDELAGVLLPHTLLYLQNNITGNSLIKLREKLITDCENQDDIEIIINKCDLYASFLVRNFYTHLLRHDNIDSFLVDAFDLDYKFIKAIELIFNIK